MLQPNCVKVLLHWRTKAAALSRGTSGGSPKVWGKFRCNVRKFLAQAKRGPRESYQYHEPRAVTGNDNQSTNEDSTRDRYKQLLKPTASSTDILDGIRQEEHPVHGETCETSGVGSNQPRPKLVVGWVPRPRTSGINLHFLERRVVQQCSD